MDYHVVNYAADGFTTTDMLEGAIPAIDMNYRSKEDDPYPSGFKIFEPLKWVEKLENPSNSIFVISCGGNDIRVKLAEIAYGKVKAEEVLLAGAQNLIKIITKLLALNKKVVICTQYKPCTEQDNYRIYDVFSRDQMVDLLTGFYPLLFEFARKNKIPILDFTKS